MKLRNLLIIAGAFVGLAAFPALADLTYTQGSGTTIFDFLCFTSKHCSAHVTINSAGTEIAVATSTKQPALGTAGASSTDVLSVQGIASGTALPVSGTFWQATQPVSGTFWQATQPVSAASWPLPTGAATAAKQPALGTAGTSSTDVISVQGIASGTALPVSGTFWQATQPVSLASVPSHAVTNAGTFATQSAVTAASGSFSSGAYAAGALAAGALASGSGVDGWDLTQGAKADSVCGTATGTCSVVALLKYLNTSVSAAIPAGTAIIGKVGIDQTTPGTTNLVALAANQSVNVAQINGVTPLMGNGATGTGSQRVTIASDNTAFSVNAVLAAATTGGASTTGNIAANNTTAVVIKASAGTLYGAQVYGIGSAPAYLKIYNATSATCGSGTPVKRLMIPAAATAANGAGSNISFGDIGVAFGTGITYCVTTGITDADTTAPAASTFLVNLDWK